MTTQSDLMKIVISMVSDHGDRGDFVLDLCELIAGMSQMPPAKQLAFAERARKLCKAQYLPPAEAA